MSHNEPATPDQPESDGFGHVGHEGAQYRRLGEEVTPAPADVSSEPAGSRETGEPAYDQDKDVAAARAAVEAADPGTPEVSRQQLKDFFSEMEARCNYGFRYEDLHSRHSLGVGSDLRYVPRINNRTRKAMGLTRREARERHNQALREKSVYDLASLLYMQLKQEPSADNPAVVEEALRDDFSHHSVWAVKAAESRVNALVPEYGEHGPNMQKYYNDQAEIYQKLANVTGEAAVRRYHQLRTGQEPPTVPKEVYEYLESVYPPAKQAKPDKVRAEIAKHVRECVNSAFGDLDALVAVAEYCAHDANMFAHDANKLKDAAQAADEYVANHTPQPPGPVVRLFGRRPTELPTSDLYDQAAAEVKRRMVEAGERVRELMTV
ncbi:MAG TPA: hypothetical protein VI322_01630 [Candidatus Saccharimonadia bacterium]